MSKQQNVESLIAQCAEDRGVLEVPIGSNAGPRVNAMLRTTGLGSGYFWCAAAAATWGVEALGAAWPVPLTADCDVVLSWAKKRGVLHKSGPQRGDLFLCMRGDDDAFHIGVVTDVVDEDTIKAWEGNTNAGGSPNGVGVFHRNRSRHNLWYVRWVDAMPEEADRAPAPPEPTFKVWVSPHGLFPRVITHEGRPYAPVRALVASILGISAEATGPVVGWDFATQRATINGKRLPSTILQAGVSWGAVREIGEALGCVVGAGEMEGGQATVTIGTPRQARTEL